MTHDTYVSGWLLIKFHASTGLSKVARVQPSTFFNVDLVSPIASKPWNALGDQVPFHASSDKHCKVM